MYGSWYTELSIVSEFTPKKLNKCQYDILRFLAENGFTKKGTQYLHSAYNLAKNLKCQYPIVHKNTKELQKMQLVDIRKDSSGDHLRKVVELNLKGMVVFLISWESNTKEKKESIEKAVVSHPQLFPFSKYWDEIEKIVGEESLFTALDQSAWDIAYGKNVKIGIDHLNLEFSAFLYSFIGSGFFKSSDMDLNNKEHNQRFADFLASHDELKKSYISLLAIRDIIDLNEGHLEVKELGKFRSEGELAFFENRGLSTNPLFPKQRLREIFPEYADMKYIFTGSLMNRLLWKKVETLEEKKGFHVYFS